MNIDKIERRTKGIKISYFKSLDSTNSYLLENGDCGEVCISDSQSAGRGRRGNTWVSPNSGNLYFSLCWCFKKKPENYALWSLLGLLIGIAIAETLEDIGLKGHGIKWPNDIFWQQRKMGGILLESKNQLGRVVIGIGLNLKMSKEDQKQIDQAVVTFEEAFGKTFSKDELVILLIKKLHQFLKDFDTLEFDHFNEIWNRWDILNGETVSIKHQGEDLLGQAGGIDSFGRLLFTNQKNNEMLSLSSADIKLNSLNKGV